MRIRLEREAMVDKVYPDPWLSACGTCPLLVVRSVYFATLERGAACNDSARTSRTDKLTLDISVNVTAL